MDGDGVVAAEEDLRGVLVHGALAVAHVGDVLDDDAVVGVLALLVEDAVAVDDVVDDARLGDLLGAELGGGAQVLAVVVAKVVVRDDGRDLDTGADEEVSEHGLDLGLAGLEVVASDVDLVAAGDLDRAGDEGVLGGAVDEGAPLESGGDGVEGGGGDLLLTALDGGEEVVGGVVEALADLAVTLGGGGPQDDDLVELLGGLELADVLAELGEDLAVGALDHVVGAVLLVGGDVVGEVHGGEGLVLGHLGEHLLLEVVVEDLGALEGGGEVSTVDIPAADLELAGVDHGEEVLEGDVDLLALGGDAETDGGALGEGAVEVGLVLALAGVPLGLHAVGDDASGEGGAVVTAETDEHHTEAGGLALGAEGDLGVEGLGDELALRAGDTGGLVGVVAHDGLLSVDNVGRSNNNGGIDRLDLLESGHFFNLVYLLVEVVCMKKAYKRLELKELKVVILNP